MIMEQLHLPFFLLNIMLVLVDAALGYHLAPRLLAGMEDDEAAETGVRATRSLLSVVVALYMFFNCIGYFQAHSSYLLTVTCLVLADMALQSWLVRRTSGQRHDDEE
jgi:hypothetical protein